MRPTQTIFAEAGFEQHRESTRCEKFITETEQVACCAFAFCDSGSTSSDPAVEVEVLYDTSAMCAFVGIGVAT